MDLPQSREASGSGFQGGGISRLFINQPSETNPISSACTLPTDKTAADGTVTRVVVPQAARTAGLADFPMARLACAAPRPLVCFVDRRSFLGPSSRW